MQDSTRLAGLVQERIFEVVEEHREHLSSLGPNHTAFLEEAADYLLGGKRLRAQFLALGFQAISELDLGDSPSETADQVLDAAAGLELFHAAALIHDDVIDRSATRRGRASAHESFTAHHRERHWNGSAEHFGISAAILLGDILQSWADELVQRACDGISERAWALSARQHFNRMRSEVAVGQYLDVFEEQQRAFAPREEQLERSTRVLVYKSAKYSVEAPLLIGAALAGARPAQEKALSEFGLPIGVAFQLRDDLLGVFGDSEVTGKPSGDDLVEGKRTVLVTLARDALPDTQRRIFDDLLGNPELDPGQIEMLQRTIRSSGAHQQVEEMIARNVSRAVDALRVAPVRPQARERLIALAGRATTRQS